MKAKIRKVFPERNYSERDEVRAAFIYLCLTLGIIGGVSLMLLLLDWIERSLNVLVAVL